MESGEILKLRVEKKTLKLSGAGYGPIRGYEYNICGMFIGGQSHSDAAHSEEDLCHQSTLH